MKNKFINALQSNDARTENAMVTHSTSGSAVLDLFYKMGGSRNMSWEELIGLFILAYREDPLLTMKAVFYNRDVRGGQGERKSFRRMMNFVCTAYPEVALKNLHNIPFYGRWDDIFSITFGTPVEDAALDLISHALSSQDGLLFKWMPREGKQYSELAEYIRTRLGLSRRTYRKMLSGNTNVVETLMCNGEWRGINYNSVPSNASHKYRKAFMKHDTLRYATWLESLSKPESGNKIHADAIFPHTLVGGYIKSRRIQDRDDPTIEAQWKSLPDYVSEGRNFIPVADLSGSMTMGDGLAMLASASLALYLSERNKGPFRNAFITFSRTPTLQYVVGSLRERLVRMKLESIAENTDLEKVFRLILSSAVRSNLSNEDMPDTILILSDMQFDRCVKEPSNNVMEMIRRMYSEAGYKVPGVIFWNLRSSLGVPVKATDSGVALVSGFSPSIMKGLLLGELNPMSVMLKVLNSDRYSRVTI